jgi:site-specific DNA-methyltransferase (adenine-specific)
VKNKLVHCDFLDFVSSLSDGSVDLAILDPPYNVGADKWDNVSDYLSWMQKVLLEVGRVLKKTGSLYLWGMSKNNDFLRLKLWLDENSNFHFRNWIVWLHECKIHKKTTDKFLNKHEDLLFYSGEGSTFHTTRDDPPDFQLKMHKGKYDENYFVTRKNLFPSQQKIFKNGLQLGSPAKSWWKGPSNQSAAKKYKNFMGYKSEWVCDRIIKVSSNENDTVLVPFAGYGTECISCLKLNRYYLACEINKDHYEVSLKRITEYKQKLSVAI